MAIYQRGESYSHHVTIKDRNNTKVDPAVILETIKDPCGRQVVSNASMGKTGTGQYYYYYNIPSTATYGRYDVKTAGESSSATVATFKDEFFVMPWDVAKEVRQITGIGDEKTISDNDLENICWMSYKRALKEVYLHHYKEAPQPNVNTGILVDGSNVYFQTKSFPIADINGDGSVTGNVTSCATDVDGWWINSSGAFSKCDIAITNADNGTIELYQTDGLTAIPSNYEGLYLDYYSKYESYDEDLFQQAVAYLAAHYIMMRLKQPDRITIADINRNSPILIKDDKRFYFEYKRLMALIRKPIASMGRP